MTLVEMELAEVTKLRERLYWEFTRGKNSPPVPAEITRKFWDLTYKLNRMRHGKNHPCPRCGWCGFIEDENMNLAGVCPDCTTTTTTTP